VYDKQPISVDMVITERKVKILFDDGEKLIFDSIHNKNDILLSGIIKGYDYENKKKLKLEIEIPECIFLPE
jgi:hypothetical protein